WLRSSICFLDPRISQKTLNVLSSPARSAGLCSRNTFIPLKCNFWENSNFEDYMTNPFYATALLSLSLCSGHAASLPEAPTIPGPSVVAAIGSADYCYARVRGIVPERMPPSYLVLELHIKVAYRNPGPRPLLMPTEHERAVYSAIKPGVMNLFREMPDFLQPSM